MNKTWFNMFMNDKCLNLVNVQVCHIEI